MDRYVKLEQVSSSIVLKLNYEESSHVVLNCIRSEIPGLTLTRNAGNSLTKAVLDYKRDSSELGWGLKLEEPQ